MDLTLRLPGETLCHIFHFSRLVNPNPTLKEIQSVRVKAYQRGGPSSRGARPRMSINLSKFIFAWLALTHVCSRWRILALDDTHLWTDVPVTMGKEWLDEFVSRSGQQPISIDWKHVDARLKTYLQNEMAPIHYQRMRNFHAELGASDPAFPLLSRSWPKLEELELELIGEIPRHKLFDACVPRLRHLKYCVWSETYHCDTFPWHIQWLDNLVVLDIELINGIHDKSMSDLMDALGRMPHLRHLRLGGDAPLRPEDLPERCTYCYRNSARLQHVPLKTLTLACNWTMITHVMSHIVPPPSVRIVLDPNSHFQEYNWESEITGDHLNQSVHDAFTRIRGWRIGVQSPHAVPYAALELTVGESGVERLLAASSTPIRYASSEAAWCTAITGSAPDLEYHPCINPSNNSKLAPTRLPDLLRTLAADNIRVLSIGAETRGMADGFLDWLMDPIFKHVEVLRLPSPSPCFLRPLSVAVGASGNSEGDVELFPALRVLDFYKCKLAELLQHECMSTLRKLSSRRRDGPAATGDAGVTVHLRVAFEVWRVRKGHMGKTSLRGMTKDQATSQVLNALNAIPGVKIIEQNVTVPYLVQD